MISAQPAAKTTWFGVMPPDRFQHQELSAASAALVSMFFQAATEGGAVPVLNQVKGTRRLEEDAFLRVFKEACGLKLCGVEVCHGRMGGKNVEYHFASEDSYIQLYIDRSDNSVSFSTATRDTALLKAMERFEHDHVHNDDSGDGSVHVVTSGSDGMSVDRIGVAGKTLQPANYELDVLDQFAYVKDQVSSPYPDGRLTILSGPPGSGKTHLIRDIVTTPGAKFVILPAGMIESAGSPDLLPALARFQRADPKPLVLILEDGDHALVARGADNISAISALLNLGDGIIGSMMDVRVVLTTNARKLDMDQAALRSGRLCRHIKIGELSPSRAEGLLATLTCFPPGTFTKPTVLADVYAKARALGWRPQAEPEKVSRSQDHFDIDSIRDTSKARR